MRLKIIRLSIIVCFVIIIFNLFYIQGIRGNYYLNLSLNNHIRLVALEGWRGLIKDRNGKILADNRLSFNVAVLPQDLVNRERELFAFLSEVLGIDSKKIIQRYRAKKTSLFAPVILAEDISREKAIVLEENKYRFPSLLIQETTRRFYPFHDDGAHLLGYVGKINRSKMKELREYGYVPQSLFGYGGVEEYYDNDLRGEEGGIQIEVNHQGQQVRLLGLKEPRQGKDITLTVDADIQALSQGLLEGKTGSIILMDMDNGEILGLTSAPSFDPNIFLDSQMQERISSLFVNPASPLLNRAIQGVYPPGSVFKVVLALAGLSNDKITLDKSFFCNGVYELGGTQFNCTHEHGSQNLEQSLAHSCNIYYYHLGLLLGADSIFKYAHLMELGNLTQIDLPYEEKGFIPSRRKTLSAAGRQWYTGDTLNFSIGQGMTLATPLQLVRVMAMVANNGRAIHPHIIRNLEGKNFDQYSSVKEIPLPKNVFQIVQKALRQAVVDTTGTAQALNIEGLHVAGKTGTAQSTAGKEHHAWFVGYVKGKKNLAFCVFLEHGGSSSNACVIARDLLLKMREKEIL